MPRDTLVHDVPVGEVFDTVVEYLRLARRRWYVLLAAALVGGGIAFYYAASAPERYDASLTFLINEEDAGVGAVSGLLGNIGLGAAAESYNLDKIVALSRSNKILGQVLLDTLVIDGVADLVVNHVITAQGLDSEWELGPGDRVDGSSLATMSDEARNLLRNVSRYVSEGGMLAVSPDSDTGILTISCASQDERLSFYCTTELYEVLSAFYTAQSISSRAATVEKLQAKADSLRRLLETSEAQLARRTDTRLGVLGQESRLRETRLRREIPLFGTAYAQVLTNLETANFALSTSTPFFSTIDTPFLPLPILKRDPLMAALGGAFVGFGVAFVVLALHHFIAQIRASKAGVSRTLPT